MCTTSSRHKPHRNKTETKKKRTIADSLCDSGGIQTHNLLIRSQMLYSVELRNLSGASFLNCECKGTMFFSLDQTFWDFFSKKVHFPWFSCHFLAFLHLFFKGERETIMQNEPQQLRDKKRCAPPLPLDLYI